MGNQGIEKLGFIGGGAMAEAIIKGILGKGLVDPASLWVSDINPSRLDYLKNTYGVQVTGDSRQVLAQVPLVVMAVKPQHLGASLESLAPFVQGHGFISIAAGVSIQKIMEKLPEGTSVIRVMPNTPSLIGMGAAALAPGAYAGEGDVAKALAIFQAVGVAYVLEEKLLDAVTGLSGSGPAYVYLFIEALIDAGVHEGLPRNIARELALQTVLGSAQMVQETGQHPAQLKDQVTSPGGTTIAALRVMESGAFRGLVIDGVREAVRMSVELGKK